MNRRVILPSLHIHAQTLHDDDDDDDDGSCGDDDHGGVFPFIHVNVAKPSSLPFSLGNATTNKSEQTESQRSQQGLLCFICRHNSALQTKQRKAEEAFKPLHCSFFSFLSLVLPSIPFIATFSLR